MSILIAIHTLECGCELTAGTLPSSTESLDAGKAAACEGCPNQEACQTAPKGPDPDLPAVKARMATVKRKILVLSGKGGVGKSTFTSALGWALASDEDLQVSGTGLTDAATRMRSAKLRKLRCLTNVC